MRTIRIGSRASQLALTQANYILGALQERFPQVQYEIIKIQTKGDQILDKTLDKIGGKGLFVKEIQAALLEKEIDLAVHSMKDMPAFTLEALKLAAIPKREDPRDVLVTKGRYTLETLPEGAVIGSSSLRRQAQLLKLRPDLNIVPIRGNVGSRIDKIETQQLHGIILAAAGLNRLGLNETIDDYLPLEDFVPAVGQGALGCEIRTEDTELDQMLQTINHEETYRAVMAERRYLEVMEGGCHIPIGAYGVKEGDQIRLTGLVATPRGEKVIRETVQDSYKKPVQIGQALAERVIQLGGKEILDAEKDVAEGGSN